MLSRGEVSYVGAGQLQDEWFFVERGAVAGNSRMRMVSKLPLDLGDGSALSQEGSGVGTGGQVVWSERPLCGKLRGCPNAQGMAAPLPNGYRGEYRCAGRLSRVLTVGSMWSVPQNYGDGSALKGGVKVSSSSGV